MLIILGCLEVHDFELYGEILLLNMLWNLRSAGISRWV